MIRAVFFDWFHTLADIEPPRHQVYLQVFRELGVELPEEKVRRGILLADQYFFEESAKLPAAERSPEEQLRLYLAYPRAILSEAGVKAPQDLATRALMRAREQFKGMNFALFDDVLPTLEKIKHPGLTLGLLTNLDSDMAPICRKLGLEPYLDFVVTAREAGADKPKPPIFLAALARAGVSANEAAHVGDQYQMDVVGARGVGISPVLIDRYDMSPEVTDCPRIHRLTELPRYL